VLAGKRRACVFICGVTLAERLAAHRVRLGADGLRLPPAPCCCGAPRGPCRQSGPTSKGCPACASHPPPSRRGACCKPVHRSQARL